MADDKVRMTKTGVTAAYWAEPDAVTYWVARGWVVDPSAVTPLPPGSQPVTHDELAAVTLVETAVKSAAYTAAAGDLVPVDTTAAARTVTLPAATAGRRVGVRREVGTNTLTIAAAGTDKIGSGTATSMTVAAGVGATVVLQVPPAGGRWQVVASYTGGDGYALTDPAGMTSAAALAVAKLAGGVENVTVTVLGDSTGAGVTTGSDSRGPWLLTQWLAARHPEYTVTYRVWNDTGQVYDAATTVQTGTGTGNGGGPFTLAVYNGSVSGSSPTYLTSTRAPLMVPVEPDCLIVNWGHNISVTPAAFATFYLSAIRLVQALYPSVPVMVTGQNARTAPNTASDIAQKKTYVRALKALVAQERFTYLPVFEAFQVDPRGLGALVQSDGIHPTAVGYTVWGDELRRAFGSAFDTTVRASRAVVAAVPRAEPPIFVPGNTMFPSTVVASFPVVGAANGLVAVMRYHKGAALIGALSPSVWLPSHWQEINLSLLWSPADATAGNVQWRFDRVAAAVGAVAANSNTAGLTATAPGVAYQSVRTTAGSNIAVPSRPMTFRVFRDCANAADTYAGIADVQAIIIERAA